MSGRLEIVRTRRSCEATEGPAVSLRAKHCVPGEGLTDLATLDNSMFLKKLSATNCEAIGISAPGKFDREY